MENDVASIDMIAFMHAQLANDAAGRMLYFLDITFYNKLALSDYSAG